jgi:hypothetical protein
MFALDYRPFSWDAICGQKAIVAEMKKRSLKKDFPTVMFFAGDSGTGKAQPLTAQILTPSGYVQMGSLKIGDTVIDGTGNITKVAGIFPQGKKEVYRLTFSDGTSTLCTEEHLWKVYWAKGRTKKFRVMSLHDILAEGYVYVDPKTGWNKWLIHLPIPCIHFDSQAVNIDPYLLGVLLGDGCLGHVNFYISLPEEDVRIRVGSILKSIGCSLNKKSSAAGCYDYSIVFFNDKSRVGITPQKGEYLNPLKEQCNRYKILCKSIDRRIPLEYLFNSENVRIKLLQGLMDTDGTIDKRTGGLIFSTSSHGLSDDFAFLVRSLGGTDTIFFIKALLWRPRLTRLQKTLKKMKRNCPPISPLRLTWEILSTGCK